jgi:hypothetical protein
MFIHRRGTHVNNGTYYLDQNPENTIEHYASVVTLDIDRLAAEYETLRATAAVPEPSPTALPEYYSGKPAAVSPQQAEAVMHALNERGYWPAALTYVTRPYIGSGSPDDPAPLVYRETLFGKYNTAPYKPEIPVTGISTAAYIKNMFTLICFLRKAGAAGHRPEAGGKLSCAAGHLLNNHHS